MSNVIQFPVKHVLTSTQVETQNNLRDLMAEDVEYIVMNIMEDLWETLPTQSQRQNRLPLSSQEQETIAMINLALSEIIEFSINYLSQYKTDKNTLGLIETLAMRHLNKDYIPPQIG